MQATVKKWGNSLGFRIPKSFANQAGVSDGSKVDIVLDKNRLIITPRNEDLSIDELLGKVTPENIHDETDFGAPLGNEIW